MSLQINTTKEQFWERKEQVQRFASRSVDHRLQELVINYPDPSKIRVLDLGCAAGRNIVYLAQNLFMKVSPTEIFAYSPRNNSILKW